MKNLKTVVKGLLGIVFLIFTACGGSGNKDQDGNSFKSVKIGKQEWMAENLNVVTYRNGEKIIEAKTNEEWSNAYKEKKPAWCYENCAPANKEKVFRIYNWYAVNDSRNIAPLGWHVPTRDEYTFLIDTLGGLESGIKMKSISGWKDYDAKSGNGTNESGFTAFPCGSRNHTGKFSDDAALWGGWWSSTEAEAGRAWCLMLSSLRTDGSMSNMPTECGYAVRCVKDK